jgi:hypothetical protein
MKRLRTSLLLALPCLVPLASSLAESGEEAANLVPLAAWQEAGSWTHAAKVVGSTSEKKWKSIQKGEGVLYNGSKDKANNLLSKMKHGDVDLTAEFMIPKGSNSGIYLMERYEVQIIDSCGKPDDQLKHGDCGGIYQRWDESKEDPKQRGFEGTAPSTNAATAAGTWQTFRIKFRAPRFDAEGNKTENARFLRVEHNGVVIHEDVEVTGPTRGGVSGPEVATAPFKVQGDHGPVAFRKFSVKAAKYP